jgi:drug/metabolite transporter (DMT)-like permease
VNFLILGAVFTGFAGFVYWEAMRHLPVAVVSIIMYIEPATAVLWAAAFLDETPNLATWLGIAFVIAGGAVAATAAADTEVVDVPATL